MHYYLNYICEGFSLTGSVCNIKNVSSELSVILLEFSQRYIHRDTNMLTLCIHLTYGVISLCLLWTDVCAASKFGPRQALSRTEYKHDHTRAFKLITESNKGSIIVQAIHQNQYQQ